MIQLNNFSKAVLLCALLLGSATSCDVLNQEPPAAFTDVDAFADADRIAKSALGMYDGLQNAEFLGGRALIYGDVRSDDTDLSAFFSGVSDFSAIPNTGLVTNAWTGGYRSLYSVNYFLQQLAKNTGKTTAALETQYTGEGKFIRALVYFHLVNLFAQPYRFTADASHLGVPLQLTAPDAVQAFESSQQLPRATVAQVYAQIEKDLNEAIPALPENYTTTFDRTGRATKDAARALLSRVRLYKGDYAGAAAIANDVITGGRRTLNPNPVDAFRTPFQTSENIFSVAMNSSDNPNTNNALGQHYG